MGCFCLFVNKKGGGSPFEVIAILILEPGQRPGYPGQP